MRRVGSEVDSEIMAMGGRIVDASIHCTHSHRCCNIYKCAMCINSSNKNINIIM